MQNATLCTRKACRLILFLSFCSAVILTHSRPRHSPFHLLPYLSHPRPPRFRLLSPPIPPSPSALDSPPSVSLAAPFPFSYLPAPRSPAAPIAPTGLRGQVLPAIFGAPAGALSSAVVHPRVASDSARVTRSGRACGSVRIDVAAAGCACRGGSRVG